MNLPYSTSAHLGSDFLHQTCHVHLGRDEKVPLILGLKVKKKQTPWEVVAVAVLPNASIELDTVGHGQRSWPAGLAPALAPWRKCEESRLAEDLE